MRFFFNFFIDELLILLHNTDAGVRIGQDIYNCFAYADDVTLFSATIPGLQQLINVCSSYASKWRFVFGIEKTRILCLGNDSWCKKPTWYLGNQSNEINNVSELNLLGLTYTTSGSYDTHIQNRISAPGGLCTNIMIKAGVFLVFHAIVKYTCGSQLE